MQTNAPAGAGGATLSRLSFNYDSRGRLYKATDLVGTAAEYRYDKNSNRTKILDGRGNTTTLSYGPNNEPTGVTWPGGNSTSVRYDAAGRVNSATDERGIVTNFVLDVADNLTDIVFPAYPAQNVHFTYDNAGRLLTVTDATGSRTYTYDPNLKRLTSVTTTLSGLGQSYSVSYAYFGDGTVSSMTATVKGVNYTTSYQYDQNGRMTSLTDPFGNVTSWQYDHAGRITRESTLTTSATTLATNYTWGVSGQAGDPSSAPAYLRTIAQTINGQAFWNYTLTHSYLGQLLQQTGTGQAGLTSGETFGYDSRGRLTSDADTFHPDAQHTYTDGGTYQYDLANNLQGGVNGWVYNSNNQVTSAPAMGGLSGGTGLTYDASGNLTSLSGSTLGYDCWGHLTSVGSVTFTYDASGRRVSKTSGGVTTYFLYAGNTLLAEVDASGNLLKSYTWGAQGLLSDRVSGQSRFYLFDSAGNTRNILSPTGTLLSSGAYTAWGRPFGAAVSSPFGWKGRVGQYLDSETGLLYLNARYYAPALGRFVSRDPIGFAGGINLYAYCGGDPVNYADPSGKDWQTFGAWLGGGIGFLVSGGNPWVTGLGAGIGGYFGSRYGDHRSVGRALQDGITSGAAGVALGALGKWLLPSLGRSLLGRLGIGVGSTAAANYAASHPDQVQEDVQNFENYCYMRVAGEPEVRLIQAAQGAVPSLSAKGGLSNCTRVFEPDLWPSMKSYFEDNLEKYDNPSVVQFFTNRPVAFQASDAVLKAGRTGYVDVDDLNGLLSGLVITPFGQFK